MPKKTGIGVIVLRAFSEARCDLTWKGVVERTGLTADQVKCSLADLRHSGCLDLTDKKDGCARYYRPTGKQPKALSRRKAPRRLIRPTGGVVLAPSVVIRRDDKWSAKPVVIPSHVEVQRLPGWTHNRRVQCAPGERPEGAGFSDEWERLRA